MRIQSNLAIPGLNPEQVHLEAELKVTLGFEPTWSQNWSESAEPWHVDESYAEDKVPNLSIWKDKTQERYRSSYADGTSFFIDMAEGKVWAVWSEDATIEDTATYLLGPVFGLILLLRGVVSLHASAIAVNGRAIALMGRAGAGKSTLAAAFARLGFPVLSEDVACLDDNPAGFRIEPGYPRIRLWPESVRGLFGAPDALPRLTPNWDKCFLDLISTGFQFQREPVPLAAIYLVTERQSGDFVPFVDELRGNAAFMELVSNTYANRIKDDAMRAHEFEILHRLISSVPIRRLHPHNDISRIDEICNVIVSDLSGLSPPQFHLPK